jgi:hypothetical protein
MRRNYLDSLTKSNITQKQFCLGQTLSNTLEVAHGVTQDISSLLQVHFYQPTFYYDRDAPNPASRELLGW